MHSEMNLSTTDRLLTKADIPHKVKGKGQYGVDREKCRWVGNEMPGSNWLALRRDVV